MRFLVKNYSATVATIFTLGGGTALIYGIFATNPLAAMLGTFFFCWGSLALWDMKSHQECQTCIDMSPGFICKKCGEEK